MSGIDKSNVMERLKQLGWREARPDEVVESSISGAIYEMVPPQSLWAKRPKAFYCYDAQTLQNLLGEPTDLE